MEARYRQDYPGEFVILESKWSGGKRTQKREWIANPIENQHISNRAVCIGSNADLHKFNYTILQRHRGGLLGTLKLQTYGLGTIAKNMRLDFAVEDDSEVLNELIESKYYENNIVYTTAKNCIAHPGDFYLIPLRPRVLKPALPIYLAAFDGHKEIFMLGYTKDMVFDNPNWREQINEILLAYPGTKFYFVGEPTNIPEVWLDCANTTTMPYRDFIGYCDV
jgi:hypothetical protein